MSGENQEAPGSVHKRCSCLSCDCALYHGLKVERDELRGENERLATVANAEHAKMWDERERAERAEAEVERLRAIPDEDVIRAQTAFSEYEARNGRHGWSPKAPSAAMRAALEAARS